uniref:Helix-turn-helix domain-containing protein n=1 Tax=uncultured bacterium Contig1777 TaxID=1393514 RepID=W0FUA2_9BACT|nr:hypothetical protein [uncultured bacterium Contig1777]
MVKKQNGATQDKPFQSIKDAARTTGLSVHFLRTEIKKGTIPIVKAGVKVYVNIPRLLEKLDSVS